MCITSTLVIHPTYPTHSTSPTPATPPLPSYPTPPTCPTPATPPTCTQPLLPPPPPPPPPPPHPSPQSAVYVGSGYVTAPEVFRCGAIVGLMNLFVIWGGLGMAWWKFLGLW